MRKQNQKQKARCHSAEDARLILHAIIWGFARWEWLPDRSNGELCVNGLRYSLDLDAQGDPILHPQARRAVLASIG